MNQNPRKRISTPTAVCLVGIALCADVLQFFAQLLLPYLGVTILGGAAGAVVGSKVGATGAGAVAGTAVGAAGSAVAAATGVGAAFVLDIGTKMAWLVTSALEYGTYGIVIAIFLFFGVRVWSHHSAAKKVVLTITTFLVESLPFLTMFPGLTIWTIFMIIESWKEDKKKDTTLETRYNEDDTQQNFERLRKPIRRYVHHEAA